MIHSHTDLPVYIFILSFLFFCCFAFFLNGITLIILCYKEDLMTTMKVWLHQWHSFIIELDLVLSCFPQLYINFVTSFHVSSTPSLHLMSSHLCKLIRLFSWSQLLDCLHLFHCLLVFAQPQYILFTPDLLLFCSVLHWTSLLMDGQINWATWSLILFLFMHGIDMY